jgi:hypothetical protein
MDQFDEDFDKYIKSLERRMWKCLGFTLIIGMVVILLCGICYK